ncbi:MAG: hypothetical protein J2P26_10675, partial [Nocardiopsaceae bacterium]|nr:hypothetical protein [Nocardiopsaceae bacterium]
MRTRTVRADAVRARTASRPSRPSRPALRPGIRARQIRWRIIRPRDRTERTARPPAPTTTLVPAVLVPVVAPRSTVAAAHRPASPARPRGGTTTGSPGTSPVRR